MRKLPPITLWMISDTHGMHSDVKIPKADIVIHCGDAADSRDLHNNLSETELFLNWFSSLSIKNKILVPGNHDIAISKGYFRDSLDRFGVTILDHNLTEVEGLTIFGSPYTPSFGQGWAYNVSRGKIGEKWGQIPQCDILASHGPSRGFLDVALCKETRNKILHVGCSSLGRHLKRIKPKIHCFGHVHDDPKNLNINSGALLRDFWRVNCSVVSNGKYKINNSGFLAEIGENIVISEVV